MFRILLRHAYSSSIQVYLMIMLWGYSFLFAPLLFDGRTQLSELACPGGAFHNKNIQNQHDKAYH